MSVLEINVILEEEIIMYEDDQRLYSLEFDDYRYTWLPPLDRFGLSVKSLGDAKSAVRDMGFFRKFKKETKETFPKLFGGYKEKLICNYCHSDGIGKAEVFLRKITVYIRPPEGSKDMKVKMDVKIGMEGYSHLHPGSYNSSYIYRVRSTSAYCKKCGLTA